MENIQLAVLNLMPVKQDTERQLLNVLQRVGRKIDFTWLCPASHKSKNTSAEYLDKYYLHPVDVSHRYFDGLIVTGAPIEKLPFESVDYWQELTAFFDWADINVRSTMLLCWAAFAGLYYRHGIPKYVIDDKISGVFTHRMIASEHPLLKGFNDLFYVPQSRFTEVRHCDVDKIDQISVLSESDESGIYILADNARSEFYVTGHSEYAVDTLNNEYHRDINKGLHPSIPKHYYPNDDPSQLPIERWREHGRRLYENWIRYFVAPHRF